jgi:putative aldouronate transport system substrate-binding protein
LHAQDFGQVAQADEQVLVPLGINDATLGLYSPTDGTNGATLTRGFTDGMTDVIAGRRPMSDFDQVVRDWVANGGDKIRHEYEQALASAS